ncbi:multidrug effflux MFS transporter [Blastococcus sp. BMG 814]|uniref:Multidrug effflux MFS transporter n=1 Tax=Blastococcus carthaginiensis TaxID=3050034 RepID=A0ABT9IAA6_9ACTN|nr:multidrug effflux MFS transporter [Blastococcus carthaginiensis]MDP5182506.1 multidrug effflux MFS transporter [Blastococcus carthaginiensis]
MTRATAAVTSTDRRNGTLVLVLGGLTAVGPLSGDTYLPALPTISTDLGVGHVAVQLTLTASFVGLGLGQLLAGPFSDRYGRRRLLLLGTAVYVIASLGCTLAPSIDALIGCRFAQGLGGAVGIVVSRAVVRDVYAGAAAVAFFSRLLLVFGVAPIVAPLLGVGLLHLGGWRVIFAVLSAFGAALFVAVAWTVPETLPPERRSTGGVRTTIATARTMLTSRVFLGYALACGLAFSGLFSYLGTFPFIVQEVHGQPALVYGALFALNAAGLAVATQVNARLARRVATRTLLGAGLGTYTAGALTALLLVTLDPPGGGGPGLAGLGAALFVVIASLGCILPNAMALAMERFPAAAGTASALLGGLQFLLGAVIAPLVGLGGRGTAVPLGISLAILGPSALLAFAAAGSRRDRPRSLRSG